MTDSSRIEKALVTIILLLGVVGVFYVSGNKVNQYGMIDTLLSLPTSQALWETGHVYLDPYIGRPILPDGTTLTEENLTFRVTTVNGKLIDFFPAGSAILTLPLTAVLSQLGYDFVDPGTNLAVQNRLAFLTGSIALLLCFALARLWLPRWPAVVLSLVAFFGSIAFSTLGSAFWSINYTVIFNLLVVILLSIKVKHELSDRQNRLLILALGVLLFLSFFCRVSSVVIVSCVLVYLLLTDFRSGILAGSTAFILLLGFAAWSYWEYGLLMPPYYGLNRLDDAPVPLWVGLLGNLVSPSRGFFVYMPWVVLPLVMTIFVPKVWRNPLVQLCALWFVLQVLIVSQANIWWGGGSFGPRLLTEAMPAVLLFTAIVFNQVLKDGALNQGAVVSAGVLFCAAGLFAIWLHSYQAFFNPYTHWFWYDSAPAVVGPPAEDMGPYFDWSVAQWRSDDEIVCQLDTNNFEEIILPNENSLEPIRLNQAVDYLADQNQVVIERSLIERLTGNDPAPIVEGAGNQALFRGMYVLMDDGRWTSCVKGTIYFRFEGDVSTNDLEFELELTSLDSQDVAIGLNGIPLGTIQVGADIAKYWLPIPENGLKSDGLNELEIAPTIIREPINGQDQLSFSGPLGARFTEMTIVSD